MKCNNISGNVVFIILIAVALFGALSYAVTQGFSGANANRITKQQAKAAAAAIVKYATDVEQAVSRLQLVNDCTDEQISFERHPFDGSDTDYVNANAPVDFSCHVFHSNGGAVPYMSPPENWFDGVSASLLDYGDLVFQNSCVEYVGTSYPGGPLCNSGTDNESYVDVIMFMPYINLDICRALNIAYGHDAVPIIDNNVMWSDTHYSDGDFPATPISVGMSTINLMGAACLEGDTTPPSGTYHYFHVLIAR